MLALDVITCQRELSAVVQRGLWQITQVFNKTEMIPCTIKIVP